MGKKPRRHDSDEEEEDEDELLSGSDDDGDALESGAAGPSGRGRANGAPGEREPIYNIKALHDKLEDIGWVEQAEWAETLTINHEDPTQVQDVDDDLARELAFYNQALSAAQQAIRRFEAAGIPWQRPPDYYAEMVKTDQHMAKVKEQLMAEQKQIEGAEERRKQREAKLYGKQVQQAKLLERQKDKKRQIEGISKLRKQREKSGFAGELDYDAEIKSLERDRLIPRGTPSMKKLGQRSPGADKGGPINKKRQARDAKFGYGGSKKLRKQNDAYSAADMDSYKPARFSDQFGGGSGGGPKGGKGGGGKFAGKGGGKFGGKGGGLGVKGGGVKKGGKQAPQQRPGKQRRQAMKGKGGR